MIISHFFELINSFLKKLFFYAFLLFYCKVSLFFYSSFLTVHAAFACKNHQNFFEKT